MNVKDENMTEKSESDFIAMITRPRKAADEVAKEKETEAIDVMPTQLLKPQVQ